MGYRPRIIYWLGSICPTDNMDGRCRTTRSYRRIWNRSRPHVSHSRKLRFSSQELSSFRRRIRLFIRQFRPHTRFYLWLVSNTRLYMYRGIERISLHTHVQIYFSKSHQQLIFIRSEEHTSELQSRFDLVCRLLLEKK